MAQAADGGFFAARIKAAAMRERKLAPGNDRPKNAQPPHFQMNDLLIRNIRIPGGGVQDIRIRSGRIDAIGERLPAPKGMPVLEGEGCMALPGAIDMHVHFRTPGGEHKETLLSGAQAAIKGGTTTCADMPNTTPRTTTLAALEEKIEKARGAPANLLFNFGAEADNLDQVRAAAAHPSVKALKIYMGPSTGQGGLAPVHVEAHFRQAGVLGLPVMVHAEDIEQILHDGERFPHDAGHHHLLRGGEGELRAIRLALDWAETYGVKLHLAHCTQAEVIDLADASPIRERVFVEVCPHHLLLSTEGIVPPLENRYKVNPPLRPEAAREALFARLPLNPGAGGTGGGGFDGLGSDHAPHTLAEKEAPYDQAPSGIPGVEYLFPLAVTWWLEDRITLERLIAITSDNAARFFGLNKGRLAPGFDGDLVLIDTEASWRVARGEDRVASRCGWTLYENLPMRGKVVATVVGGRVVGGRMMGSETSAGESETIGG